MHRILVVDDEPHLVEVVSFALQRSGFATGSAADGEAALRQCALLRPDLVVLDVLMPSMDGYEVCRRLRADPGTAQLPILFLSSRDEEVDRVVGLELGADDYLAKPFSPRELVARVRAILRRSKAPQPDAPATLSHGQLSLDLERYRVAWAGREASLTLTEFGLLKTLMERPGKVCTRDHLMHRAYELQRTVSDRTIDSHMRRLRAKLAEAGAGDAVIETAHGIGYRLGPCQ